MPATATGARSELINVLGDVKARVQDKLGVVDFPMPQFILIGKQSVGKSRLCEALAGETFNFISGTLGSRRPTVLEFRNVASAKVSRWYVRSQETNQWMEKPVAEVMQAVGDAHEMLGADVSEVPVYVRLESANSVDMQIVDLPGFRDFANDASKQLLAEKIDTLVRKFMTTKNNVMLCVEQASDAATMSTLGKCREIDPKFERTILIRNKLDKYYTDLTNENVNKWVDGFGDLPENLMRFAVTLPWWADGAPIPKPFHEIRAEKNAEDIKEMESRHLSKKFLRTIGFANFQSFMENKIEKMFVESINPVLTSLRNMKDETEKKERELRTEFNETDPNRILSTTRDCGTSFATALTHVMEGVLRLKHRRMTLEDELKEFHAHHEAIGSTAFDLLPGEDFCSLADYVDYLRNDVEVGAFDVEINGGAQFRRLMIEVEIFLRFSEIATETTKRDVIQARGVSMSSLSWRDVVVKLLSNEAHLPLQRRVLYVGERIKWFFEKQKEVVIEFMESLEGNPSASMFSPLYPKHVKLVQQNEMIKHLVFQTYDEACSRQLKMFIELFDNMLSSTFSNPWVFLKGSTPSEGDSKGPQDAVLPSFDDTKARIPQEIRSRTGVEMNLSKWLQDIPTETEQIDVAVDKVQQLVIKTYSFIRSQVCDQVELFSESFFKLPMMRRLEENMSMIELSDQDKENYEARRQRLEVEAKSASHALQEISACVDRLNGFKLKCEARGKGF
jgi:GTP-binding protein EngB required for normal cell division